MAGAEELALFVDDDDACAVEQAERMSSCGTIVYVVKIQK